MLLFIIRAAFSVLSEIAWHGQTFGKHWMKTKGMFYGGPSLTIHALVERNLMKEAEIFLPATLFLTPDGSAPEFTILVWMRTFGGCPVPLCHCATNSDVDGEILLRDPMSCICPSTCAFLKVPRQTGQRYIEKRAHGVENARRKIDGPELCGSQQRLAISKPWSPAQPFAAKTLTLCLAKIKMFKIAVSLDTSGQRLVKLCDAIDQQLFSCVVLSCAAEISKVGPVIVAHEDRIFLGFQNLDSGHA
ncbi:MAG: hypothetical protein AAFO72_04710 [Pseudomonadota bacterium]